MTDQSKGHKGRRQLTEDLDATFTTAQSEKGNAHRQIRDISRVDKVASDGKQVRSASNASPVKQVRFSDIVEERTISSDDESNSSSSSHSSLNSNIDEKAQVLLQGEVEWDLDYLKSPSTWSSKAGPSKALNTQKDTNSSKNLDNHPGLPHYETPRRPKMAQSDELEDRDNATLDTTEVFAPSNNNFDKILDCGKSRFERQKSLSPLSKYVECLIAFCNFSALTPNCHIVSMRPPRSAPENHRMNLSSYSRKLKTRQVSILVMSVICEGAKEVPQVLGRSISTRET